MRAPASEAPVPRERALPREAMWFFVAAPPVLAFLFDPSCVMDPPHVARALVAITSYTVLTGLAVHLSFEWVAARAGALSLALRVPLHALACALVVTLVTLPQLPFIALVYPEAAGSELDILWRGVLVSYVYLAIASLIAHLARQAVRERMRAHQERTAALEARLAVLQAQMQPHFLFNSLNVCAGLVHEDPDAAEGTLDRLSGFMRYALESTERRLVPLRDELDAVASYLEVQKQRFGERLRYRVDADEAALGRLVPPMLLQPIVENALHHGLRDREAGGEVRVRVTELDDGALRIAIEDDGVGPGASRHRGTGTGERNVRERLAIVYGERASLASGRSEALGGYACTLTIPATMPA
ncbi:MAG: histidine kinase [Sandaracinaceae bacterium]|nr:histidine kinase [Sandaracinaceae bacterium]